MWAVRWGAAGGLRKYRRTCRRPRCFVYIYLTRHRHCAWEFCQKRDGVRQRPFRCCQIGSKLPRSTGALNGPRGTRTKANTYTYMLNVSSNYVCPSFPEFANVAVTCSKATVWTRPNRIRSREFTYIMTNSQQSGTCRQFYGERENCYIREASANDGFIECKVPAFGGVISYKGVAARTNRPVERDREKREHFSVFCISETRYSARPT